MVVYFLGCELMFYGDLGQMYSIRSVESSLIIHIIVLFSFLLSVAKGFGAYNVYD